MEISQITTIIFAILYLSETFANKKLKKTIKELEEIMNE